MDIRQKALSAYQRAMSGKGGPIGEASRTTPGEPGPEAGSSKSAPVGPEGLLKTTAEAGSRVSRVARFLLLLGTDEAAKVLRHLPEGEVDLIVEEIDRTEDLSMSEARRVLAEFGYRSRREIPNRHGGRERAREMLTHAFGQERAEEYLRRGAPVSPGERFSFLHDLEPHQIEHLLRKESMQVRAMVMAHLPAKLSAQLLSQLPDREKLSVSVRLAKMGELSPEVLERVAELLKERIRKDGVSVTEEVDGTERLAEILRYMNPQEENSLLDSLRGDNADIAEQIEQRLYSIDIIHDLADDQLERVLRRVDDQEIALLLKGKAEAFRSKMLRNLSERRQRIVVDEYHNLGPVRRGDVEQANRDFVELLKRLAEEGEIVATWRGDDYT
ncbi:MAG: flagellar motor switch protein FliG [Spirochaetaceae bacterium]